METDIPLRTLTAACAPDLLPLLGAPDAEVLGVESLELPALATRLDNILRLRDGQSRVYLHLVEWQGYRDREFLWRVLGYLGWLGQNRAERPIAVTLVYLQPGDDVGDTLRQEVAGQLNWEIGFRCVRLWEEDAAAAVRGGRLGQVVLSPLMRGATAALVEEAARVVLAAGADPRRQADLLNVLGVLAEPLVTSNQFMALVGKERLMASELLNTLLREKTAELEREHERERAHERAELQQERAELQQERAELQQELERQQAERERVQAELERELAREQAERERAQAERERAVSSATLAEAIEEAIVVRFPTAPLTLATVLHRIQDPQRLRVLLGTVLRAPDLASVQQAVEAAAAN